MPAKPLSVTVPETLLKRIRSRARRAKRTVEAEVIQILTDVVSAQRTMSTNGSLSPAPKKKPRTSLADWAEKNAEHWGGRINSEDVESFTGRRY